MRAYTVRKNLQYSGGDDDAAETGTVFPVDDKQ